MFIHKDKVTLTIDTTGVALHKRGYREKANKAPIRETLAAAIMYLTPWKPGRTLVDPMCGSGTLLIEAAMMGINMAPGLNREFISEKWRTLDKKIWWDTRREAYDLMNEDIDFKIYGYDIDEEVIEIARENAEIAGVENYIEFNVADATEFKSDEEYGFIVTNPPYRFAKEFVERAIDLVDTGRKVCMFLKITFLEGQNRKKFFAKYPPKVIYVSSSRISCAKNGDFDKYPSSAMCFAWYVWEKGYKGETVIKWIN